MRVIAIELSFAELKLFSIPIANYVGDITRMKDDVSLSLVVNTALLAYNT